MTHETVEQEPSKEAQANADLQLTVLTNENTYSAAVIFVALIHDCVLGKIVGSEPGQEASHFGDTIYYQLSNTKITGSVSYSKFVRPDPSLDSDPKTKLLVDVPVNVFDDPLQIALEMFREK